MKFVVWQSQTLKRAFGGDRAAGGGQRMTYRVRSNALADPHMPNFKSCTISEFGAKELASEAERSFSAAQKPHPSSLIRRSLTDQCCMS